jgi:hypothetical protein
MRTLGGSQVEGRGGVRSAVPESATHTIPPTAAPAPTARPESEDRKPEKESKTTQDDQPQADDKPKSANEIINEMARKERFRYANAGRVSLLAETVRRAAKKESARGL